MVNGITGHMSYLTWRILNKAAIIKTSAATQHAHVLLNTFPRTLVEVQFQWRADNPYFSGFNLKIINKVRNILLKIIKQVNK